MAEEECEWNQDVVFCVANAIGKQTEKCKGCANIDNPNGEVEDDLLKDLLDKSYNLVLGGFSKKKQKEILESGDAINGI